MKRFTRILGILAGIGAVVWAMRDRFISLTVPKEPEPPAFKRYDHPAADRASTESPQDSAATSPQEPDDLTEVNGIGPVFAGRLREAGITSFGQLAGTTEESLMEILGSRLGKAESIIEDARRLAGS